MNNLIEISKKHGLVEHVNRAYYMQVQNELIQKTGISQDEYKNLMVSGYVDILKQFKLKLVERLHETEQGKATNN